MPKAWRKCSMCPVDSYNRPDLVIFSTQVKYKNSTASGSRFICELHYQPEDMKVHGGSKRFVWIFVPLILKGLPRHKHKTQIQRRSLGKKHFTKFGLPNTHTHHHPQAFRTLPRHIGG